MVRSKAAVADRLLAGRNQAMRPTAVLKWPSLGDDPADVRCCGSGAFPFLQLHAAMFLRESLMRSTLTAGLFCLLLNLTICRVAQADQTFCIDPSDPGQTQTLSSALQTWVNDNSSQQITIKMAGGTYAGVQISAQQIAPSALDSLVLLGGYQPNSGCNIRDITSYATVLDGGGAGVFAVAAQAPISIDGLTFVHMYHTYAYFGVTPVYGVQVQASSTSSFSRLIARQDATFHIWGSAAAKISIEDCLIYGQTGDVTLPALEAQARGSSVITVRNCTVVDSPTTGIQMDTSDSGKVSIENTIAYGNSTDVLGYSYISEPTVSYSIFGTGSGFHSSANTTALSEAQLFVAPGNYHLAQASPAIDQGDSTLNYASPFYPGGPAETDLEENPRVIGTQVDIGAYESYYPKNHFIVTSSADDGSVGTLRWAIGQANIATGSPEPTIVFAVGCPATISLLSGELGVTSSMIIDARTQSGWKANSASGYFNGNLCIHLTNASGSGVDGLHVLPKTGAQLVVYGMTFDNFFSAVLLEDGAGHVIAGSKFSDSGLQDNFVGVNVQGTAGSSQIGGSTPEAENVFGNTPTTGFAGSAIVLGNAVGYSFVEGNLIGLASDGITNLPNGYGIFVNNSPNNTIASNYIGNSAIDGIYIGGGTGSQQNVVQQNVIGTGYYGTSIPIGRYGVNIDSGASNNTVGSVFLSSVTLGNRIQNSGSADVYISPSSTSANYVLGNELDIDGGSSAIDTGGASSSSVILRNSFSFSNSQLVAGVLNGAPSTLYRIDFYHSGTANGAGLFAGALLPSLSALYTDGNGHCSFLVALPKASTNGYMSAAATGYQANTSEIGSAVAEQGDGIFVNGFGATNGCQ